MMNRTLKAEKNNKKKLPRNPAPARLVLILNVG